MKNAYRVNGLKDRILTVLKGFGWQQWVVLAAFVLTLGITGFEIYRAATATHHFRHHRDEPIRGWMSVPMVAHSYHVPPRVLYQALGLPVPTVHPDRRPLKLIAREQNRPMEEIRITLEAAIQRAIAAGEIVPDHSPAAEPGESPPRRHERREPGEASPRPVPRGTP